MLEPCMMLTFAACAAMMIAIPCHRNDDPSFTVASYNIRSFKGMDDSRDIARTTAAVNALNSDICGLQEVRRNADDAEAPLDLCARGTGMAPAFAATLQLKEFTYGIAMLSRMPYQVVETLTLPIPDGHEPRTAIIARVSLPGGGHFYFVNTHLSARRRDAGRREQLKLILDTVRSKNYCPAILTGDLNALPDSETISLLRQEWQIFGDDTFTFPARKPDRRIDYIACYPKDAFRAVSYQVVDEPAASDHRPLVVKLVPNRTKNKE